MRGERSLILLAATTAVVLLCIAYVDRPLTLFFNAHIAGTTFARAATVPLAILRPLVVIAFLSVIVIGLRSHSDRSMSDAESLFVTCAVSVVLGVGAEFILKQLFGRSDVSPTFIRDHVYGFDFLHAHDGWWAFPSGTAIGLFAVVSVLYARQTRMRGWALTAAILLSLDTLMLNYHWLSDMIAGAFVGLSIGRATAGIVPNASPAHDEDHDHD